MSVAALPLTVEVEARAAGLVFLTQLLPSSTQPLLRSQLRQLTYQALVD